MKDDRFLEKYKQDHLLDIFFVDKETGVNYLCIICNDGIDLTPLINRDGKLIITNEDIE